MKQLLPSFIILFLLGSCFHEFPKEEEKIVTCYDYRKEKKLKSGVTVTQVDSAYLHQQSSQKSSDENR